MVRGRFPDAAGMLNGAAGDVLAFTEFPQAHWRNACSFWRSEPSV